MVSKLSSSLIRGCHPTFSSTPCNDDWYLMSIIDYYRIRSEYKHPNPALYWRYTYDMKWGWNYSITDFKTHSIKEYILVSTILKKYNSNLIHILLSVHRISPCSDVSYKIKEYLSIPNKKDYTSYILRYIRSHSLPTSLPKSPTINALQLFIGRCKYYGFLHHETNHCIISRKKIFFDDLINHCKRYPRPYIAHPYLKIQNKKTFFSILLVQIAVEDQKKYTYPVKTPLLNACHYNFTGIENHTFYHYIEGEQSALKQRSIIDTWVSDLFGW
jgi:hypothetical protein